MPHDSRSRLPVTSGVSVFPALSTGILFAFTTEGGVVYDLVTERLSLLNASGAALCAACRDQVDFASTVRDWAGQVGVGVDALGDDIRAGLAGFVEAGLVGRDESPRRTFPPDAPVTPMTGGETGTVQAAGMHRIRFRSTEPLLVELVDGILGLACDDAPTAEFALLPQTDGSVRLITDTEWHFPHREELAERIVTVVNDFVARTTTEAVLHAAALRSPAGRTVVFPAAPGNGKSTLAAALVQRGWAYAGDESATIRGDDLAVVPCAKPILLDTSSCAALGLPTDLAGDVPLTRITPDPDVIREAVAAPVTLVVPRYVGPGGDPSSDAVESTDALVELVGSTLNLRYVGERGLETLVHLSETVPMHRIAYRSTDEAVARLTELGFDS